MAVDLSALAPITTAAGALSGLILVTPQQTIGYQPQNPSAKNGQVLQQAPSLAFNYEGENTVSLESDITDHFVEDNTAIQDQISLKPEVITVHGFVGEVNDITPKALAPLKTVADKLTSLTAYTPALTATALIAYNEAFFAYQVGTEAVNAGISAWSSLTDFSQGTSTINGLGLTGQLNQNTQQNAFQQFYGYWRSRRLFTVQTPWAIFQDCAIQRLRAIQDAETRVITDFEVSFKLIRFATATLVAGQNSNLQSRAANQASGLVDLGATTPVPGIGLGTGLSQNFPTKVA